MKTKFFFLLASLTAMSMLSVSCGGDDDDPKPNKNSQITSDEGMVYLLTNVGSISFTYDDEGRVLSAGKTISISYNPLKVTYTGSEEDFEDFSLSMNSNSLITGFRGKYSEDDGESSSKGEGSATISYSNGQITGIVAKSSSKEVSERYDYNYEENTTNTIKFTWQGGVITRVTFVEEYREKGVEEGERFDDSGKVMTEFTVEYGDNPNVFRQGTMSFAKLLDMDDLSNLALVGMFGKAPAFHISSITKTNTEADYTSTSTYKCYVSTDNMDKVTSETIDRSSYTYSYRFAPELSRAGMTGDSDFAFKVSKALFTHHRSSHKR